MRDRDSDIDATMPVYNVGISDHRLEVPDHDIGVADPDVAVRDFDVTVTDNDMVVTNPDLAIADSDVAVRLVFRPYAANGRSRFPEVSRLTVRLCNLP